MAKKKLEKEIIGRVLAEHYPWEMRIENALALLVKWSRQKQSHKKEQLLHKLGQKGYSYEVAKTAYARMLDLEELE